MIKEEETKLSLLIDEMTLCRKPQSTHKVWDLIREFSKTAR